MSARLAEHIACVPPSGIRKFFDIVSEMKDAISLGVGEPDFVTPWAYSDAAIYSMRAGHTHYTSNWGLIELRRAINEYQRERFGLEYQPENEILVTVGASEGIDLALRAIVNPGDEVLVPDPSYVSYAPGVRFSHGVCVPVPTRAENGFRVTAQDVKAHITPKTKAIILPYPNNPTGAVMPEGELRALAAVLRESGVIVISDEIYAELTYAGTHHSIAAIEGMRDNTIVLNGFSMTGWRMGWACAPKDIMESMFKIHQYTMLCAPTAGQYAALEALRSNAASGYADVQKMVRAYDRRRRFLVKALGDVGLSCFEPLGAFYAFPSIVGTGLSSDAFCEALLYDQKVAAVPGTAFGQGGEGHIRLSYATSLDKIEEAVRRMGRFLEKQKQQSGGD